MATRFRRTAAALAAVFASACADMNDPATPPLTADDAVLAARLADMGFARSSIVDAGHSFVVEGDMVISKFSLRGLRPRGVRVPAGPRGQWVVQYPVLPSVMRSGITIELSGIASSSAWTKAARDAMMHWEWVSGTNTIRFNEVSTSTADIHVKFGTTTPSTAMATAQYPVNGYPGWEIIIRSNLSGLSAAQMEWIMIHELGHTIGMRHSNWKVIGDPVGAEGYDSVPNTPSADLGSVMRGNVSAPPSFTGFNANDKAAASYLYPAALPSLTSQGYDGSNRPTLTWSTVPYASGYFIRYTESYQEWVEDPSRYEGGYWSTVQTGGDIGSTTATSFTDTTRSYTGNGSCTFQYQVWTVYPNGKQVPVTSSQYFDVC